MIRIRSAGIEDLNDLVILFNAYRVFYNMEPDLLAAKQFLEERILKSESRIFVAEDDKKMLQGFVQLYPIFSSTRMKPLWLLNDLFVAAEQRGKGISKKLIIEAQQLCRTTKACGLILETAKSNIIGNQLYLATGFSLDNDHNYYSWDV